MHDPRVGRFFARDPLAPKYPFYSPYQVSGNRVIDMVELEGLEPAKPDQEEYTGLTGAIDWAYQHTGGDKEYSKKQYDMRYGDAATPEQIDKSKFLANNPKEIKNRYVSTDTQFFVSREGEKII